MLVCCLFLFLFQVETALFGLETKLFPRPDLVNLKFKSVLTATANSKNKNQDSDGVSNFSGNRICHKPLIRIKLEQNQGCGVLVILASRLLYFLKQ